MWGNHVSPRPCLREGLALTQGDGKTRFPHPPTRWEGVGGRSPCLEAGRRRLLPPGGSRGAPLLT